MNRGPTFPASPIRLSFGGVDGGECSADVLKLTYPSQVDDFKRRLVPIAQGIDASVATCAGLTAADRASWAASFAAWSTFAKRSTPWFGSSNEWQTTCSYAKTFDAWRAKLAATACAVAGPSEIQGQATSPLDLVRWIAIGGGIIGVIALGLVYAPEIKAAVRRL